MKKEDEEKTTFYTDHGTFCYQKMSFGLKNAGATNQRLVDRIFAPQIGRNIEVYVDDMVIKSRNGPYLLEDVQETLITLEKTKMKLNPAKCSFAVEEGQFLGYYITNNGIRPNPSKVQDLVETTTPATLKDMQGLNGKLTALGRFVAKSAEKAIPLFNTLKEDINKSGFKWTANADKACQQLKKVLTTLPTLSSPVAGETLVMYISAAREAISAILATERESKQSPVYFVSRALQGPEVNYSILEKLVLALIYAARRLRRYFQAHKIEVRTSQPLKKIMMKPETSGRLAKWAIELEDTTLSITHE
ncbi:hypothetical protein L2E82_37106 [Cichorium intybus]|uniref:Uncharacterized protein n=1 Tax=Cichorium intybus TaxID=13427 RepID=A0ACB9ADY2_CICIN|nr:hypothetical protein L2E82_37106 [Cichorium intybus]